MSDVPACLSHYYEKTTGPFRNLSDLPFDEAEHVLAEIRARGAGFASARNADYLKIRRDLEDQVRHLFIEKGGQPVRARPHYMILGVSPWLLGWYEHGCELCIPLENFSPGIVSFTYGDTFPAMRYQDHKPYRGQVYRLDELPAVIEQYGLPQEWNRDGRLGPDRYIEAQIWDDEPLRSYLPAYRFPLNASGDA